MPENKLLGLSFEFAVMIVNLVDGVTTPKGFYTTDQLARAGTSIGANIHEAQYVQSKRIDTTSYQYASKLCGNIRRLLIASCKAAKERA